MNNATKTVTATGELARGMICDGLEVAAEIDEQEPAYQPDDLKGLDRKLHRLVHKYGVKAVLASIHDAAIGAAEVHEDCDDRDEVDYGVVSFRLQVFGRKMRAAMDTLG
jgi:hypothetical protein